MSDIVKYNPNQAVGNRATLEHLLELTGPSLIDVLPEHLSVKRLCKMIVTASRKNPKILECTQASVLESVMTAAELGLEVSGPQGHGYLVPMRNKGVMECSFMPGYKGLINLAWRSGEIKRIMADMVYSNDIFAYETGSNAICSLTPCLTGDRGDLVGAYALVEFVSGGIQTEFMRADEIKKIRRIAKTDYVWKDWFDEQAKKTVFRRLSKWLPLSSVRFFDALEASDKEYDLKQLVEVESSSLNETLGLTEHVEAEEDGQ